MPPKSRREVMKEEARKRKERDATREYDETRFKNYHASVQYNWVRSLSFAPEGIISFTKDVEKYGEIKCLFEHQGWMEFLNLDIPVNVEIVRLFYANLGISEQNQLCTFLGGKARKLSPKYIASRFNPSLDITGEVIFRSLTLLPDDFKAPTTRVSEALFGRDDLFACDKSVMLTPRLRIIHKICRANILEKGGEANKAGPHHKLLLYRLITKSLVDLPSTIVEEMRDVIHTSQTPNLRYGRLITLLAKSWGMDVTQGETIPVSVVFAARNISLTKLDTKRPHKSGVRIEEPSSAPEAEEEEEGAPEHGDDDMQVDGEPQDHEPHGDDASSSQSQVLQALYDKVETLGHQMERLSTRNEQRWDSFQHGFEQTMAHYFGPMGQPPPSQSFFTYYGSSSSQQPGPSSSYPAPSYHDPSYPDSSYPDPDPSTQDPSSWDSWHSRQFQDPSQDPSWP